MESLAKHNYSGIDNGTIDCQFLQGFRSTELETEVNVFLTQPVNNDMNFDAMELTFVNGHREGL